MTEIRVATIYLENLASRMDELSDRLTNYADVGGYDLTCSPTVKRAFDDRADDWNVKRDRLSESLGALAEGFRTASRSISQTDQDLAEALYGSGSGGEL